MSCICFVTGILVGVDCVFCWCLVERTAGTMMQRMSDMLTRWLEGAMRRTENEGEADDNQDQSDSSEHESPAVTVHADTSTAVSEHESPAVTVHADMSTAVSEHESPAVTVHADMSAAVSQHESPAITVHADMSADVSEHDSRSFSEQSKMSAAVEEHVEASLQDVANLRLSPSPVNSTAEHASGVVNDVSCLASCEVEENVSLSDCTTVYKPSNRTSTRSDNLAVSGDNESMVDSRSDSQNTVNRDSEADSKLSSTLHSEPESDVANSGCTSVSIVVDGADSVELVNELSTSLDTDVSTLMQSRCDQVTVSVEEKAEAVDAEESPDSHS